jgi:hypothetical protein
MHPHGQHFTGMGLGAREEEDPADFILDDADRLTSRDLAIARYRRNHELLNLIFDARRIDRLTPAPSPYAEKDVAKLREQLKRCTEDTESCKSAHSDRVKLWKKKHVQHEMMLHASNKRTKSQLAERAQQLSRESESDQYDQNGETLPAWARNASTGQIIGVGYVRATTPEDVRIQLPKPAEPVSTTAVAATATSNPVPSPSTQVQVNGQDAQLESQAKSEMTPDVASTVTGQPSSTTGPYPLGAAVHTKHEDGEEDEEDEDDEEEDGEDEEDEEADADGDADAEADEGAEVDDVHESMDLPDAKAGGTGTMSRQDPTALRAITDQGTSLIADPSIEQKDNNEGHSPTLSDTEMASAAVDMLFADGMVEHTTLPDKEEQPVNGEQPQASLSVERTAQQAP